jgi:hypothetical protein
MVEQRKGQEIITGEREEGCENTNGIKEGMKVSLTLVVIVIIMIIMIIFIIMFITGILGAAHLIRKILIRTVFFITRQFKLCIASLSLKAII